MSKRFQMVAFKGSTQEKLPSEIFRFGYGKALNDKKVPDRVGSGEKRKNGSASLSLGSVVSCADRDKAFQVAHPERENHQQDSEDQRPGADQPD
jgi:hypothetical protein